MFVDCMKMIFKICLTTSFLLAISSALAMKEVDTDAKVRKVNVRFCNEVSDELAVATGSSKPFSRYLQGASLLIYVSHI